MSPAKKEATTYSAEQLEDRLAARYRTAASEILFGVRNDAGFSANRTADAIAVGLWPSTGCSLEGFEIKVSRGDWTRELREGSKSEAFMVYMDFWWLVAPREIVTDDELPPAWGLLSPSGEGLRVVRQAKRNPNPLPMPRGMLAALVKRASTQDARKAALEARYREGVNHGKAQAEHAGGWESREYKDLRGKVDAFRKATGISVEHLYDPDALRRAYTLVKHGGHLDLARQLGYAATNVERLAKDLRATVASIESVTVPTSDTPTLDALEAAS